MSINKLFVTYYPPQKATALYITLKPSDTVQDVGRADTIRSIAARTVEMASDVVRTITDKPFKVDNGNFDFHRNVEINEKINSDTRRYTGADYGRGDFVRSVSVGSMVYSDFIRNITENDSGAFDTIRDIKYASKADSDMSRIVSARMENMYPVQIGLSLQKGTISDVFNIELAHSIKPGDAIQGKILDFPYTMYAYEVDHTGLIHKVTGMYDVDKLLYTPFTYYSNTSMTAKDHAKKIAKVLGKHLDAHFDDFYPSDSYAGTGATIQNLAGSLFGWAGNLPQRWINVFIRGNTLHIIQRGKEPNSIDITGAKHSRPEVNQKILRSVWSGKGSSSSAHSSFSIEPLGFSGTILFGEAECTYSGGYLVRSVITIGGKTETTSYSYREGYVTSKNAETADSISYTRYSYADTGGDKYLASEETTIVDKRTGKNTTELVQHAYLGSGFYGTAHYTEGVQDASSVSSGKPGGKASKFTIDQSNLGLGGSKARYPEDKDNRFTSALFDTEFPISNTDMLKKLTKDIEWLDRKVEETVSMDIWQYGHVIDFTDKITFDGNVYSLESNHVTQTPTELKQSVVLKRWY